jgi:ring-1,2-phenylacetyl-CoA epoxidase subunit PaaD
VVNATHEALARQRVVEALASVHDPEIPPCSIVDLGIVERVTVADGLIEVDLLPTFAGCPALDFILEDAESAVREAAPGREIRVRFVHSPPWTSDRITPAGRAALQTYGVTPPGEAQPESRTFISIEHVGRRITCPFCGSGETVLESAFGPTLCRSTHFCRSCRNPFEAFKPKAPGR